MALALLAAGASSASATMAEEVNLLPTPDNFNRSESPLSNSGKWQALGWDTSTSGHNTGRVATGWGPSDAFPVVNGAYWSPNSFNASGGAAAALTMTTGPGIAERYLALWLDMSSPASAKSGYQLRWTVTSGSTYSVSLVKWSGGTETVLASNASVTIAAGSTLAISDAGGTVTAWQGSGGALTSLLTASDTTYSSGYAGVEGSGNISRTTNFQAGPLMGSVASGAAVLDNLERNEVPLATGKWSKSSWSGEIGGAWMGGYRGYGSNGGLAGAYWNQASFNDAQGGDLVAGTVGTGATPEGQYLSLWLDMPNPGGERSGYEARFTGTNGTASAYKVELSKWVAGNRTVLASASGFSLPVGTTMALTESGGRLVLWAGTSALTPVLNATDTTYASGYAGLDVNGGAGTIYNFRAGQLGVPPPETSISFGPKGTVLPRVSFGFSSSPGGASFECSLDGAAFGGCSSPAAYQGLSEAAHTFKVRANGAGGPDPTPAERSFQVLTAAKGTSKVPVRDNLERNEVPLATGKWSKTSWAAAIGGAWMGGYRGYGSSGGLAGAYWNQASYADGEEVVLVSGTVGTGATPEGQYLSLWLDMPNPGGERSGYEARFTGTNGTASAYKVELSKWVAGNRTVLASASGFSLPVGTTMTLSETSGGELVLWTGSSSLTAVISATDTTYSAGYAGLEVNGGAGTIYNFRAGRMDLEAPNTTIESGPTGSVLASNVSFAFTSSESGSSFECSVDGAAYASCSSPKAYPSLAAGPHTFKVRALDAVGNADGSPAERSFEVLPAPSVTTSPATDVKAVTATLQGKVNPNGTATTYQFEYGPTTSYGTKVPATAKAIGSGGEVVAVDEPLTGLTAGTTYHYRLVATSAAGTGNGSDQSFATTAAPVATTEAATGMSATEATFRASVNPKGAATTYQFEYGPTAAYGTKIPVAPKAVGSGQSAVAVSETPTGLVEGTTYHFRIVAENEVGVTYGQDQVAETPLLPEVTTEAASAVKPNEAILNATVDPNGSETDYTYEYGKTTSYGSLLRPSGEELAGSEEPVEAIGGLANLEPETTYHYRAVASSAAGVTRGADQTLTTGPAAVSPQREAEEFEELNGHYTGKFTGGIPGNFVDMMWDGDINAMASEDMLNIIRQSGAKMIRVPLSLSQESIDRVMMETAAKDGMTILPGMGGSLLPPRSQWGAKREELETLVHRYGPNGTFWQGKGYAKPIKWWEVWNEENWEANGNSEGKVKPKEYGEYLEEASKGIKAGDPEARVLLGGLLAVSPPGKGESDNRQTPSEFLRNMYPKSRASYDAVSLHPYVFKYSSAGGAPTNHAQVVQVKERVREIVQATRATLDNIEGENKEIWVTELGWPVREDAKEAAEGITTNWDTTHLPVSDSVRADLIKTTFEMLMSRSAQYGIRNVFYYNIQDRNDLHTWDYRCGLLRDNGEFRQESFNAFMAAAQVAKEYPRKPKSKTTNHNNHPRWQIFHGRVNPEGLTTKYRFEWGAGSGGNFPNKTEWQSAGFGEGEVDVESGKLTGFEPGGSYHYRVVAKNTNNQESEPPPNDPVQFTTPPSTVTTATVHPLNGEPGWASVSGWVKEGGEEGLGVPEGPNMFVNVVFEKETATNVWEVVTEKTRHPIIHAGQFSTDFTETSLGKGNWRMQAYFPGAGEFDASHTDSPHKFTIKNAYQLVNKGSGRCLEIAENSGANGAGVHQWDCGDPHTRLDQDFTLVPMGGANYELVARHSNKCVDVTNAAQYAGAGLQQYQCLGAGQTNQVWEGVPIEPNGSDNEWVHFVAKHSGQCLEIQNGATNNGAVAVQNPCGGQASQLWTFESVEGNPVPSSTYITLDETLYGHPGYETFHGTVESTQPVAGQTVYVNFKKWNGSSYVYTSQAALTLNAAGQYSYSYYGVGSGDWEAIAIYPGAGNVAASSSPEGTHRFHVGDGYRFKFRNSGKCLSTSGGGTTNGTAILQWDCSGAPSPGDGQVYSIVPVAPVGSSEFQIRPDSNTNMCLDVTSASPANGANLQLYQCLGEGQSNQIWHILPLAGQTQWFASIARHSNKCMDVTGQSTANGARIDQWECWWGANQQWEWQAIG